MHKTLWPAAVICLLAITPLALAQQSTTAKLLPAITEYAESAANQADSIPVDRKKTLSVFATQISEMLQRDGSCKLNFICTHNSRRSHLSQVWAQIAAVHYGVENVATYSGGTEATACNIRTIAALKRAGLAIKQLTNGSNPHYEIRFSKSVEPLEGFSKVYSDTSVGNPDKNFIAAMCCSDADKKCPIVHGSVARIPLHYVDPKVSDNTPLEAATYDERCRQIAIEMFYVMSLVSKKMRG